MPSALRRRRASGLRAGNDQAQTQGPAKTIGSWPLTLMTLGGIIGAGLFLASAQAIRLAGPAVIVAYAIGALAMVLELSALAEMAAADPVEGSFLTYARRALGSGPAFIGGWIFWFSSVLNLAAEATAAATFLLYWFPQAPIWMFSMGIAALITLINFLPVQGFGEVESGMSILKLTAIALFVVVAALSLGGLLTPHHRMPAIAYRPFWPHGMKGVGAAMVVVMFSMAGTGVLGLAASAVQKPKQTIPAILPRIAVAVLVLYVLSALAITGLVSPARLSPSGRSPFVAALSTLHLGWAPSVLNGLLLVAVLSAMNAGLFATNRVLAALGRLRDAPRIVAREQGGLPRTANLITGVCLTVVSALSFLLPKTAFLTLVTATSFQALFIWVFIVTTEIFYRRWLETHHPERLVFRLPLYPWLSIFEILLLLAIIATAPLAPGQVLPLGIAVGATAVVALAYLLVRSLRSRHAW